MAIVTKELKNTTGTAIVLSDLGDLTVPALSTVTLGFDDWVLAAQSSELETKIDAGDIVVRNPDGDLPDTATMKQWLGFFPINDGRYYTESETDTLLAGKSDVGHTHDHSDINDDEPEKHRLINDAGPASTTELYSSNKIESLIDSVRNAYNRRAKVINIVDNTQAPPTEVSGDRYILDFTGGGVHADWDGASAGDIVEFDGSSWVATTPEEGWVAYVDSSNKDAIYVDDGTPAWELRPVAITNHNDLSGLQGGTTNEYYHLTATEYSNLSQLHDRQHALDSTADHTGISGTEDNFMSLDANGLPQDSGYAASDFAEDSHTHDHNTELTGLQGGTTGQYYHLTSSELAGLHARSHTMTSTSDHSAGNWKVWYSDGSGNVQELALGAANTILTSNGASAAPTFESPTSTTKGWHQWNFYKAGNLAVSQYAKFYEVFSNKRPATSGKNGEIKRVSISVQSSVSSDTVVAIDRWNGSSWAEFETITLVASGSPTTAYKDSTSKTFSAQDQFRVRNKSGVVLAKPEITVTFIDT